ncbi:hypothetical protein [Pseudoxanthomonas winnipegensis]|uniref:hypothetical protein n=1 Tax=Pseudoxanthomonas winnipegensis TaxID=2480810 RepID=UPI0013F178EA|nr:hypothetical protein [Pseudoxanthomonas winnipegensis]
MAGTLVGQAIDAPAQDRRMPIEPAPQRLPALASRKKETRPVGRVPFNASR